MKRILVVYHSQQKGHTRKLAELVAKGCREVDGVDVELVNVNEARADMEAAERADAFALGSPDYFSYVAGGLKQFFDDLLIASWAGKNVSPKPCVLFLTHGGGGTAVESLVKLAKATKLEQIAEALVCRDAPETDKQVADAVELGRKLASHVTAAI